MTKCNQSNCKDDALFKCAFCGKEFCEKHYIEHMNWERKFEGLAEDAYKIWRKKSKPMS
ncbi:MAG: hypothetical protein QW589_07670 [Candidatus Bathyarchaeia archaeon]